MTQPSSRVRTAVPRWRRSATACSAICLGLAGLAAPPAQAAERSRVAAAESNAPVTLNFVNADIEAVTRAIAAMINRQMLVDPRVRGTITVYSERPVSPREGFQNYLAALRGLGFAVVESGGLLKVVPEADAKLQTGVVSIGPVPLRGDQIITQVFKLSHENPNNLVAILRPLISPNNTINANPGNSSLVITDYADNLARVAKIIAALDQPASTDVEVVPLKHALAADMVALVQKLGEGGITVPGLPGAASASTVMADARSNSLIVRASSAAKLAQMRALIERLDRPSAGGPAGTIRVVYLKNADATKLAAVLRAAFGGSAGGSTGGSSASPFGQGAMNTSPTSSLGANTTGQAAGATVATTPVATSAQPSTGGYIQADPATNSLVITAPDPLFRQIQAVIEQLDGRRAQVYVETMVVEMEATKAAEFGFQWQGLLGRSGNYGLVGGTNFGSGTNNIVNLSAAGASIASSGGSGVSVGTEFNGLNLGLLQKVGNVITLGALARFLETVSGTNILTTPNVMALDNEEAKIVVGANVPFVTGSFTNTGSSSATVNPFQTVERKDVGLTLKIKPQIGEGGVVRMVVYQENSSVVATTTTNTNGPTTNKNSVETTVVANDGQIIVLGGQTREQYDDNANKVPFLGDVPVVGGLFRNESRNRSRRVLLLFLRPVVVRDAQASESLSLDRYEAIRAQQKEAQPARSVVTPINEGPVLPPMRAPESPASAPLPDLLLNTPKVGGQ